MYMRSRSLSRNKFHNHISFLVSLDIYDSIIFKYSRHNQVFLVAVRNSPVFSSQSMVINNQLGSIKSIRFCQKFSWHGTRKNVMRENGLLFQHRHFLHDKFLVNYKSLSLQIHKCWYGHDEQFFEKASHSSFFSLFKVLNTCWRCNLHDLVHYVGQRIIRGLAIK